MDIWDETYRPLLRALEAYEVPSEDGMNAALRDPSGLADSIIAMSPAALLIVSMMDGSRTCRQIRQEVLTLHGQILPAEKLENIIERLREVHFLEGKEFEAYYQGLQDRYHLAGVRDMRDTEALGITDDSGRLFDELLATTDPKQADVTHRGIVAPHLDYPRGAPCYASAYGSLVGRCVPDRVVVLGTNHFGRSTGAVATSLDFSTPLGTTPNDVEFLDRLEANCGNLRTFELDHAKEHSIELQVAWLQHLFGADRFKLVPILCSDPCGPTGTASYDGQGVDLLTLADALRDLIECNGDDTLIVAGADLSHVGGAFGDDRVLDEDFLGEVRQRDQSTLDHYTSNGPERFRQAVAEGDNPTRVCSAGCMFVLATALSDAKASLLDYHQAVDQPSQTCVTCAAVAFS